MHHVFGVDLSVLANALKVSKDKWVKGQSVRLSCYQYCVNYQKSLKNSTWFAIGIHEKEYPEMTEYVFSEWRKSIVSGYQVRYLGLELINHLNLTSVVNKNSPVVRLKFCQRHWIKNQDIKIYGTSLVSKTLQRRRCPRGVKYEREDVLKALRHHTTLLVLVVKKSLKQ